jgi:uncharacterized protein Yka (UPF0111/DUF47 family)
MSFNRKVKEEIIALLIEHTRIMYSVLSDMGVYYTGWSEDFESNKQSLEKRKSKMQLSEEEGDDIKIQLIQNFAEVGAQGLGDYIALILRLDNLINYPLEFVDLLNKINLPEKKFDEIRKRYHKLLNLIMKMADVLKKAIKNLRDKPEAVFKSTTTIHEMENQIDSTYRQFLDHLYSNQDLDIRILLRIRDSIVLLEQLADRIHDIADIIRVLIYQ